MFLVLKEDKREKKSRFVEENLVASRLGCHSN